MNESTSRTTGGKKAKALLGEERQHWRSASSWCSHGQCSIFTEFGQKLRQVLQPSYQAAFPRSVHPFGSPCGVALGSQAPAPSAAGEVPGAPGSCSPIKGTGLLGAPKWGPGAVASPICSLRIWRTGWQFCGSGSQRRFMKYSFFTQKPFHQHKSEAAGCLQKNLENQHYMWKEEDRALRDGGLPFCTHPINMLLPPFAHFVFPGFIISGEQIKGWS